MSKSVKRAIYITNDVKNGTIKMSSNLEEMIENYSWSRLALKLANFKYWIDGEVPPDGVYKLIVDKLDFTLQFFKGEFLPVPGETRCFSGKIANDITFERLDKLPVGNISWCATLLIIISG